jgi:hypothetical protein
MRVEPLAVEDGLEISTNVEIASSQGIGPCIDHADGLGVEANGSVAV